ncbi:MAG: hypothetical protein ACR2Q3_04305 [Woeseiaceae bacterium]
MTEELIEEAYQIDSVTPADPPAGMEGDDWHCYIIMQGTNSIRGYRQGKRRAVMTAVEEIVAQLNERRFGKRGRPKKAEPAKNAEPAKKPAQ